MDPCLKILQKAILSNELPTDQEICASYLLNSPFAKRFFDEIEGAEVVVVITNGLSQDCFKSLDSNLRLKKVYLPVEIPMIASYSLDESCTYSSKSLCRMIKNLFNERTKKLKGILKIGSGVSLNGSMGPGPMMSLFAGIPGLYLRTEIIEVGIAVSYCDYFTEISHTEIITLTMNNPDMVVEGPKLLSLVDGFLFGGEKEKEENNSVYIKSLKYILAKFPFYDQNRALADLGVRNQPLTPEKHR